jgi:hypothetical protein
VDHAQASFIDAGQWNHACPVQQPVADDQVVNLITARSYDESVNSS